MIVVYYSLLSFCLSRYPHMGLVFIWRARRKEIEIERKSARSKRLYDDYVSNNAYNTKTLYEMLKVFYAKSAMNSRAG